MKNKYIKTLIISFVTAASLTACSFNINDVENTKNNINEISTEFINKVSKTIDNTDFTSETEIADMTSEISDIANDTNVEFDKASLVRVVDGDTIVINLDGEDYKVRLIGINTPESVAPDSYKTKNSIEGTEASSTVKDMLSDVDTVYLQKDISDTDKYGRLLRYVWLEEPTDENDINEISTKMLNAILVDKGIAEVATYEPDTEYEWAFEELAK